MKTKTFYAILSGAVLVILWTMFAICEINDLLTLPTSGTKAVYIIGLVLANLAIIGITIILFIKQRFFETALSLPIYLITLGYALLLPIVLRLLAQLGKTSISSNGLVSIYIVFLVLMNIAYALVLSILLVQSKKLASTAKKVECERVELQSEKSYYDDNGNFKGPGQN